MALPTIIKNHIILQHLGKALPFIDNYVFIMSLSFLLIYWRKGKQKHEKNGKKIIAPWQSLIRKWMILVCTGFYRLLESNFVELIITEICKTEQKN